MSRQPDLFGNDEQHELLGEDVPTPEYRADPWDRKRIVLYRTIFPQMTNWLPDDEGAQLRFEFDTELARLEAA